MHDEQRLTFAPARERCSRNRILAWKALTIFAIISLSSSSRLILSIASLDRQIKDLPLGLKYTRVLAIKQWATYFCT